MGGNGGWDIDSYRSFYESDEHWALKREFLEAHYDSMSEDRLVCLAQVYVNIELLGCRYPQKVMQEVKYLSQALGVNYKETKKTKLQRTFVKASDAAGAKVRAPRGEKRTLTNYSNPNEPIKKKMMTFVKATEEDHKPTAPSNIMSFIKAVRDDNPTNEDCEEYPNYDESSGQEQLTADKCLNLIRSVRGEAEYTGDDAPAPVVHHTEKIEKYKNAAQQRLRQKITFDSEPNNESQIGRGIDCGSFRSARGRSSAASGSKHVVDRRISSQQLDAFMRSNDPLSDFILIQRVYAKTQLPFIILIQSSDFSQIPLQWKYLQNGQKCSLLIKGIHVASGWGGNQKSARDAAALAALEVLVKRCYCLRVLKLHSSTDEVSLAEVSEKGGSSKQVSSVGTDLNTPIEDTSVGSKLLKMMGWTGGGLGKDGSGISEPIKPSHIFDRQGLGHEGGQKGNRIFRDKIKAMITNHFSSTNNDLAFSPLFSSEQRALIHKAAREFQLKSQSHGKGDNRFLILSRKCSPKDLIFQLLREGSNDKYQLLPPEED